jgi:hypothetical protein
MPTKLLACGGVQRLSDQMDYEIPDLRQRWRVLYRTEAPVRIGQALLLQAVAYRLQERSSRRPKPSTRRVLERTAEDSLHRRTPSEAPATKVTFTGIGLCSTLACRSLPCPVCSRKEIC